MWKQKHFEEAESGSELGSIWLFNKAPVAEAFFMKHGAGMWKRLNFCGSGSTLKKEAGSGKIPDSNAPMLWRHPTRDRQRSSSSGAGTIFGQGGARPRAPKSRTRYI